MPDFRKKNIGEILLQENFINLQELQRAISLQETRNSKLSDILVEEGYISEEDLFRLLEIHTGVPRINLNAFANRECAGLIPEYLARKHTVFPVKTVGNILTLALRDPLNVLVVDDIRMATGLDVQIVMATRDQIETAIDAYYFGDTKVTSGDNYKNTEKQSNLISETKDLGKIPSAELMDMIIERAVQTGASDIHVEPQIDSLRVRYRIDGVLAEVANLSIGLLPSIVQRIKVLSNMDITNKRLPQDGHMKFTNKKINVDIRVSTMPNVNGEKAVLRILTDNSPMEIKELGFREEQLNRIYRMIKHPYGVVLVTGSVGSGKTTTLYSIIKIINSPSKNIVTLEEPVEYMLPGVNQIQINPKVGLTYASGIRSILRQDPNVLMIGEIRDPDTAEMLIRAALTGHLVFSTLHTNRAAGTVSRLLEMGVEPYLLASCLIGVISQTLVRKICVHCKKPYLPTKSERELLGITDHDAILWKGQGCDKCSYTGYKGRIVAAEILRIDDDIRKCIMDKATSQELNEKLNQKRFFSLKDSAMELVKKGVTTSEEVIRLIFYETENDGA